MRVHRKLGFTLVELLVVIAIIGILVALLLPAVQAAREAARRSQCSNNLKQLGLACHNYVDTHQVLPAGAYCGVTGTSSIGHCHTWIESLLPFFEQANFFDQIDFRVANHMDPNPSVLNGWKTSVLMCPSDPDRGLRPNSRESGYLPGDGESLGANYVPSAGPMKMNVCAGNISEGPYCMLQEGTRGNGDSPGMFTGGWKSYSLANAKDGTSNTFLLGESLPIYSTFHMYFASHMQVGTTTAPPNFHKVWTQCPKSDKRIDACYAHMGGFKSEHPGGLHMAMADASVQFIAETIDFPTWCFLGNKSDGQSVSF